MDPTDVIMDAPAWPGGALARRLRIRLTRQWRRLSHYVANRDALMLLPERAVVLAVIALLWVSIFTLLARQYDDAEASAIRDTGNLARAFEENTQRIVSGIDDILLSLRSDYAADPEQFDLRAWQHGHMRADRLNVQLGMIGPNGWLRHSTMGRPGGKADTPHDLHDREHFRAQLDPAHDDLFISKALVGRGSDQWTIQFTRKLTRARRQLRRRDRILTGLRRVIAFLRHVGRRQRRYHAHRNRRIYPRPRSAPRRGTGRRYSGQVVLHDVTASDRGPLHNQRSCGRRAVYHQLSPDSDLPLVVVVGFDRAQVFQAYEHERSRLLQVGGIATCIIVVFGFLWIALRRRWIVSRRLLRLTLDSISEGIILVDEKGQTPVMNNRAVELLGTTGQWNLSTTTGAAPASKDNLPQRYGVTIPQADATGLPAGDSLTQIYATTAGSSRCTATRRYPAARS